MASLEALRSIVAANRAPQRPNGFPGQPVVLHGHAHQPPRIIPSLQQPHSLKFLPRPEGSALDTSDGRNLNWTEQIHRQCYQPLSDAELYRLLSTNWTPSLLMQLAVFDPEFIPKLKVQNDAAAADNGGHGNILASGFGHVILPLASRMDQLTEVSWGIEHFRHTFGREPEGFWPAEAAVDLATLTLLRQKGIKFVVLSPHQARKIAGQTVCYKDGFPIITNLGRLFRIKTSDGGEIHAFLYNPFLARALAFSEMLNHASGSELEGEISCQLHHHSFCAVAADVETFGHHKPGAITTLTEYFKAAKDRGHRVTNFGTLYEEGLRNPELIVDLEIHDPSSWSCAHGIGRWSDDCGCEGANPWRHNLREALDSLARETDLVFEHQVGNFLRDPNQARENYIHVLMGLQTFPDFFVQEARKNPAQEAERICHQAFQALVPRHLMYVSCAWFFSGMGLETEIALAMAAELIQRTKNMAPEAEITFLERLLSLKNTPEAIKRGQPENGAMAYFNARNSDHYWAGQLPRQ